MIMKRLNKFISSILVLAFIFNIVASQYSQVFAEPSNNKKITKTVKIVKTVKEKTEIIIKYKNESTGTNIKNKVKNKLKLKKIYTKRKTNKKNTELVEIDGTDNIDNIITELNKDPGVEYAQPNYSLFSEDISTDPKFIEQWSLNDININNAWDITKGSKDVIVGVLDTGIDINHPEIANNIFKNTKEIPDDGIDNDGNGLIDDINGWDFANKDNTVFDSVADDTHGTHVSGIIAASENNQGIVGVAPNVKILPLKFIKGIAGGDTISAIEAIEYAKSMGVKIINCSFGGADYNYALEDEMQNSDILFCCSAGNNGSSTIINYPAGFDLPNIISVAATNSSGALASFSNYGVNVDIASPGEDILSISPNNSYGLLSGTSMASPVVAGVAALVKSQIPLISTTDLAKKIKTNVNSTDLLMSKVLTNGKIDAFSVLKSGIQNGVYDLKNRYQHASVTYNNKIYLVGGFDGKNFLDSMQSYNPTANLPENKTNLGTARANAGIALSNGKIYVIGGYNNLVLNSIEEYNPATDAWTFKAPMPTARHSFSTCEINGKIYIIGGFDGKSYINKVECFDPVTNSWTEKASMLFGRAYTGATSIGEKIYVIGGKNSVGDTSNIMEEYDTITNLWTLKSLMPDKLRNAKVESLMGKILVFGGAVSDFHDNLEGYTNDGNETYKAIAITKEVEEYDILKDEWKSKTPMPSLRYGFGTVKIGTDIYFTDGWNGNYLNTIEKYKNTEGSVTPTPTTTPSPIVGTGINLNLNVKTDTSVELTWTVAQNQINVMSTKLYNIFRNAVFIGVSNTNSYIDSTLVKGKSYTYDVKEVDELGNFINSSNRVERNTTLGGAITEDTIFTSYDGDYTVSSDLSVAKGVYLYIAERTVVKFDPGVKMTVLGNVVSASAQEGGVIFTSSNDPTYDGSGITSYTHYWEGIKIKEHGSVSGIITTKYAKDEEESVLLPNTPTNIAVTSDTSKITLTWATVEGATSYNVLVDGATQVKVTDNKFEYESSSTATQSIQQTMNNIVKSVSEAAYSSEPSETINIDIVNSSGVKETIALTGMQRQFISDMNSEIFTTENSNGTLNSQSIATNQAETGEYHDFRVNSENSVGTSAWSAREDRSIYGIESSGEAAYEAKAIELTGSYGWPRFLGYVASEKAKYLYPNSIHNGEGDAYKHAYWNALLTLDYGKDKAIAMTTAYENGTPNNPKIETDMDLYNNNKGADIGTRYYNEYQDLYKNNYPDCSTRMSNLYNNLRNDIQSLLDNRNLVVLDYNNNIMLNGFVGKNIEEYLKDKFSSQVTKNSNSQYKIEDSVINISGTKFISRYAYAPESSITDAMKNSNITVYNRKNGNSTTIKLYDVLTVDRNTWVLGSENVTMYSAIDGSKSTTIKV